MKAVTVVIVSAILSGCSTGSQLVTGTKHSPTTPDAVKVYPKVLAGAEEIAIVTFGCLVPSGETR